MESIAAVAATAVAVFAGTNLDDFVVLAVLNATSNATGRPKRWQIWVGQYLGVAILVLVSLLAAAGLRIISSGAIWLLGLIPLSLGVYRLVLALRTRADGHPPPSISARGFWGVAALTLANGGDNLAVYPPLFHTLDGGAVAVTVVVFAIGVGVWCALGALLVTHRRVTSTVRAWGHWIIPFVYILIGLFVMYKGGLFS